MVRQLAQEAKYADFSGPLSMISQYYEMTEYGRNTLLQSVQDVIKPVLDGSHPLPLYELFAAIAQPIMIVSSCYDRLLEQHFRAKNKTFAVVSHARINTNLNKVLIAYSDRDAVEELLTPEALSPKKLLEKGYSILYKVCGCFGLSSLEPGNTHDSIMISKEDYFVFVKQSENVIPGYLANLISKSTLLFLGNSLNDWQDRLILNAVLEKNRSNCARSYAVHESPIAYEKAYLEHNRIRLYQVCLQEFAENLQKWTR
ncbi:MAG: hypothetical protein GY801_02855 [bacterium]|nr:hypothetical protein [bacterium]